MNYKEFVCAGAAEARLEKLIIKRMEPDANKEIIDKRIWDLFGERWCVMFTDLSGFSRATAKFGIIHFLQTIIESERICIPIIEDFDGILLKTEGDSLMVIFKNVEKAINCSKAMHNALRKYNLDKPDEEKVLLCIGLGYGDVLRIGDNDVYGAEVNAASKLGEDTAKAWEILVTDSVQKEIEKLPNVNCELIDTIPPGAKAAYKLIFKD